MTELFLEVLNRSLAASWLVLAVLGLRLALGKAPRWVHVLLWGIVAVRLLCPVSIRSELSLIPEPQPIPPQIMMAEEPRVSTGVDVLDGIINPTLQESFRPKPGGSANPLKILMAVAGQVWLLGAAAMALYTLLSYGLLRRRVATAVRLRENIYESKAVGSPFVLGLFRPNIYLPQGMEEPGYVIAHEQAHIRRRDHWWKPLGFALLALHWFNPLMWAGYWLLCRDIELACDEMVIRTLDGEARADYSQALLRFSISRRSIAACPLAFGEVGVRDRVKSILHYKKPTLWILLAAIVGCLGLCLCFLTDPVGIPEDTGSYYYGIITGYGIEQEPYFTVYCDDGVERRFSYEEHNHQIALLPDQRVWVRAEGDLAQKVSFTDHKWATDPDTAIRWAIQDWNWDERYHGLFQASAFQTLVTEESGSRSTHYGVAQYMVLSNDGTAVMVQSEFHVPTVISLERSPEGAYRLVEYWEPRDGSYHLKDLQKKFPVMPDSGAPELMEACYDQAAKYFQVPASSIVPINWDSQVRTAIRKYAAAGEARMEEIYALLAEHPEQSLECLLRELMQESGSRGMSDLCIRLALDMGETVPQTGEGQAWFEGFQAYALALSEQHPMGDLSRDCPASYVLLKLTADPEQWKVMDKIVADIDGDQQEEYCTIADGGTSGLMTMVITARTGGWDGPVKYTERLVGRIQHWNVRLVAGVGGLYIQEMNQDGSTIDYALGVEDGKLVLSEPITPPDWGLSLSVRDVSPVGATVVCNQSGGNVLQPTNVPGAMHSTITTGAAFWLEALVDGRWVMLEPRITLLWKTVAYEVTLNGETEFQCLWGNLYDRLEPGTYRIGKHFTHSMGLEEPQTAAFFATFTIE